MEIYNEIVGKREFMQIAPDADRVLTFAPLLTLAFVHLLICLIANFYWVGYYFDFGKLEMANLEKVLKRSA